MALLAVIFSLILEKFIYSIHKLRRIDWFINFTKFIYTKFSDLKYWNDTFNVLVIIMVPVFSMAYIQFELDKFLAFFSFLFSIFILILCIGPKDSQQIAQQYLNARESGDEEDARELAKELLNDSLPDDDSSLIREINKVVLIGANERLFAVLFWFVLSGGPIGAVLYRLTSALREYTQQEEENIRPEFVLVSRLLYFILNWVPARLTAFSYAIIGSFVDAVHQWKAHKAHEPMDPEGCDTLLTYMGFGALNIDADNDVFTPESIHSVLQLTKRGLFVWLTVLAIATLAGWAT